MEPSETTDSPSDVISGETAPPKRRDLRRWFQALLLLDIVVRLKIWSLAIALTIVAFTALGAWPEGNPIGGEWRVAAAWAGRTARWVLLFNVIYVAELVILRLLIPTPKEGRYTAGPGAKMDRQLIWSSLLGILTKARYQAPFPGFFVFHIANLPPMVWLMGPIFGPKSRSCYFTDPVIVDPSFVEIGRNVVLGYGSAIGAHTVTHDTLEIKRTIIEDDVIVGGNAGVFGGVHLKSGCMIGAGSILRPNTVVEPNEFWAGIPARKIGMVRREDGAASA